MHMLTDCWYRMDNTWNLHGALLMTDEHGTSCSFLCLENSWKGGLHPDLIAFDVQVSSRGHHQLCQGLGVLKGNPVPDRFALQALTAIQQPSLPCWAQRRGGGGGGGGGGLKVFTA